MKSIFEGPDSASFKIKGGVTEERTKPYVQKYALLNPVQQVTAPNVVALDHNKFALSSAIGTAASGILDQAYDSWQNSQIHTTLAVAQAKVETEADRYLKENAGGVGLTEHLMKVYAGVINESAERFEPLFANKIIDSAAPQQASLSIKIAKLERDKRKEAIVNTTNRNGQSYLNSIAMNPELHKDLYPLYESNNSSAQGVMGKGEYATYVAERKDAWYQNLGQSLIRRNPTNWESVLTRDEFKGVSNKTYNHLLKYGMQQKEKLEKKIHRDTVEAHLAEKGISREKRVRCNTAVDKDPFKFTEEDIKAQGLLSVDEALALDHLQKAQKKAEVADTQLKRINKAVSEGKPLENVKKEYQNKFVESQIKNEKSVEKMAFTAIDCKPTESIDYLENNIRLNLQSNNPAEVIDGARGLLLAHSVNPKIVSGIPDEHVAMANFIVSAETLPKEQQIAQIENARKLYLSKTFADKSEDKKLSTVIEREITRKTPAVIRGAIASDMEKKNNINPFTRDETSSVANIPLLNKLATKGIHPSVKGHFELDCLDAYRTARKEGLTDSAAVYSRAAQIMAKDWSQTDDNGFSQIVKNHPHNIMPELKGTYAVTNYLAGVIEDCVKTAESKGKEYSDHHTAVRLVTPLVKKAKSSAEFLNQDLRTDKKADIRVVNEKDNIIAVNLDGTWKARKVYVEYDQHVRGRARFFFYERPDDRLSYMHYLMFYKKRECKDARGKTCTTEVPEDFIDCTELKDFIR